MASTSEVGHAKNVANFQDLIEFITAYGATYNPSKNKLKIPQLIAQKTAADDFLQEVITQITNYNTKVNERVVTFNGLKSLSTRLISYFQTTDAPEQTIADAISFHKKIHGRRATTRTTPENPNEPAPNTISTSQQSYDQLIQHLSGLKSVLESEASYAPNETDLQITTLNDLIETMSAKNKAVAKAFAAVSNARIARNNALYTGEDCIYETAREIKLYIKALFGANSPEFAQVKGIEIRKNRT